MKRQLKRTIDFLAESDSDHIILKSLFKQLLEYCAANDCGAALRLLLDGFNNGEFASFDKDQDALKLAVRFDSVNAVGVLLSNGADVTTDYNQLLCQSVSDDKYEITQLLVKYGADVNVDNDDPLRLALTTRNYLMYKLLINNGGNIDDALKDYTAYGANNGLSWNVQ